LLNEEDPDAGRLKGVYRRSWASNQVALLVGRRAIDALHEAGIDVLVLKGAALIATAYSGTGARPMADLDVAVRRDAVEAAVTTLEEAGFSAALDNPAIALRSHHSLAFKEDASDQEVDLHRGMLWRAGLDDQFWQEAVPAEVAGAQVLTLCPADQLLHVCVHGASWNIVQPFRWIADAYKVLETAGGELDWDRATAMATDGHFTLPFHDALAYLAAELEAPIPEDVLGALAAVPVSAAERRAHQALAQPPSSRRSLAMLWWFWERHRAEAALEGTRTSPAGLLRYLQGFWGLERPSQVPGHAIKRVARRRTT
jgi:hypothetical protein